MANQKTVEVSILVKTGEKQNAFTDQNILINIK